MPEKFSFEDFAVLDPLDIKVDVRAKVQLAKPDPTLYESIKNISFFNYPVSCLKKSNAPVPHSLSIKDECLIEAWQKHHAPLIESAFFGKREDTPYRSIFPGPYLPWLEGRPCIIGDTAYSIFCSTIMSIKQRIPDLSRLKKINSSYTYENDYAPIVNHVKEPEEGWIFKNIDCPEIEAISFPLPEDYSYNEENLMHAKNVLGFIEKKCSNFCLNHLGAGKDRPKEKILEIFSLIRALESLHDVEVSDLKTEAIDEVLAYFSKLNEQPKNAAVFLFEIDHAVSYLLKLREREILVSGIFGMFWIDVFKLPLENLVETELGDISRVLREIRTLFAVGFAPILVHLSETGEDGYNTDGTHRHYAILTVELLRRLKNKFCRPLREIDLNSAEATIVIEEFRSRYKKEGLSFREVLRAVNYIINNDDIWPYMGYLEMNLEKISNLEFSWVPVVYLPEWRSRAIVKNLCDKGTALVGIPPMNIVMVGRSQGKKGIFIRGGYHGTDRQPNFWIDVVSVQKNGI